MGQVPLELESDQLAVKLATGFETGQVVNQVVTYVHMYVRTIKVLGVWYCFNSMYACNW